MIKSARKLAFEPHMTAYLSFCSLPFFDFLFDSDTKENAMKEGLEDTHCPAKPNTHFYNLKLKETDSSE